MAFAGQATLRLETSTASNAHKHRVQAFSASIEGASADAAFELEAGETVTMHVTSRLNAITGQDLRVWVSMLEDNGSTVAMAETLVIDKASAGAGDHTGSTTFTPAEAGTYRIRLRARYDDDGSNVNGGYDADTDGAYSRHGATPTWTASAQEASPGYLRSGVDITAVDISNALGSATPATFAWPDTVRARITAAAVAIGDSTTYAIDADTLNGATPVRDMEVTASAASTTWDDIGGTAQLDKTDPTSFGFQLGQPANSTLSARPWVHFTAAPANWTLGAVDGGSTSTGAVSMSRQGFLTWDGRITADHHLQLNDDTFDAALDTTSRLTSDLGFVSFTLRNARSEAVDAITATQTLTDSGSLVAAAIDRSVTTGADGRPSSMATWDSQLPGGNWTHTVDITSPSGVTGQEVTPTATYVLKSVNPAIEPVIYIGPATAGGTPDHIHAGDDVQIAVMVKNRDTAKRITPDTGTVRCNVIRWSTTDSRFEYLAADETTWTNWPADTAADEFTLADSGDGLTFTKTFASTDGWGTEDIVAVNLIVEIDGTPYGWFVGRELTGASNGHDGYDFDGGGFVGFPKK